MKRSSTDYIVVHCSATPPSINIGAREIRDWHVNDNGWSDIGYHFVITRNGNLEVGRQPSRRGAHVIGYNDNAIGICLVGGVHETERVGKQPKPENNFTPAQFKRLEKLTAELVARYPNAIILGHRDLDPRKACPSFSVKDWLAKRGTIQTGV